MTGLDDSPGRLDPATQQRLGGGFDSAAGSYAVSRPDYPDAAVDWLLGDRVGSVLDLAAGSGSLTQSLVRRHARVVAAEPSRNLLIELRDRLGLLPAVQARAEALPFADSSYDVVTVGTAFHWFDASRALRELARVLRPDGRLGLVWNTREVTTAFAQDLDELLRGAQPPSLQGDWGTASAASLQEAPWFEPPDYAAFPHEQRLSRAGLVALVGSRSYVIALEPVTRAVLLDHTAALFDRHSRGAGELRLAYRSECWRAIPRATPIS